MGEHFRKPSHFRATSIPFAKIPPWYRKRTPPLRAFEFIPARQMKNSG